jgi:hypothetical protein
MEKSKKQSTNPKQKISLNDFKVQRFITPVKINDLQFLNTAGGYGGGY